MVHVVHLITGIEGSNGLSCLIGGFQMMWLNACPRCETGTLYLDEDNERHCMQCGHIQYSSTDPRAASELVRLLGTDEGAGSDMARYLRQQLQTAAN